MATESPHHSTLHESIKKAHVQMAELDRAYAILGDERMRYMHNQLYSRSCSVSE